MAKSSAPVYSPSAPAARQAALGFAASADRNAFLKAMRHLDELAPESNLLTVVSWFGQCEAFVPLTEESISEMAAHAALVGDPVRFWLEAERRYYCSEFRAASRMFEYWHARHAPAALPWMRLLALIRLSYIARYFGRSTLAREFGELALHERDETGSLKFYESDLESMHAHLVELAGSAEIARVCFLMAYRLARRRGRWIRAASAASEIGRLLSDLGRFADAITWQSRAIQLLRRRSNTDVRRTVELRMAKLYRTARRTAAAGQILKRLWAETSADSSTGLVRFSTAVALHEQELMIPRGESGEQARKRLQRAREWLEQADEIATRLRLPWNRIYVQRDRTRLAAIEYFDAHALGLRDSSLKPLIERARSEFRKCLDMLARLEERPKRMLLHLADDIVHDRFLMPELSPDREQAFHEGLESDHRGLRAAMKPGSHGLRARELRRKVAADLLFERLDRVRNARIALRNIEVETLGGVIWRDGAPTEERVPESTIPMLLKLVHAPGHRMTPAQLCTALRVHSRPYIHGVWDDLKKSLGPANWRRSGPAKGGFYELLMPESDDATPPPRTARSRGR